MGHSSLPRESFGSGIVEVWWIDTDDQGQKGKDLARSFSTTTPAVNLHESIPVKMSSLVDGWILSSIGKIINTIWWTNISLGEDFLPICGWKMWFRLLECSLMSIGHCYEYGEAASIRTTHIKAHKKRKVRVRQIGDRQRLLTSL